MKILIRGILSFKKERVKKRNLSNIKIYIHRNSKSKIIKIEEEKELIRTVNVFRRFLSILFFQLLDKRKFDARNLEKSWLELRAKIETSNRGSVKRETLLLLLSHICDYTIIRMWYKNKKRIKTYVFIVIEKIYVSIWRSGVAKLNLSPRISSLSSSLQL